MAVITICSDFGAPQNKVWHCFHCFPIYFPWSDGTRLLRYDLNQIPYDYTVEVRNRFKGLDLIDRLPDELWTEVHDIVQETGIKTIPKKKEYKKAKWLFEEALQIAVKRREWKAKEKRRDILIWMQSSKEFQGEIRKPSSAINAKK